jgi:hypothetical protein
MTRRSATEISPRRIVTEGRYWTFSPAGAGDRDFALAVGVVVSDALWVGASALAPGVRPNVRSGMSNI